LWIVIYSVLSSFGVNNVQRAYQRLQYRLEIMAMANLYVSQLDIGRARGQNIS
jgi:hypothetical protein